MNKQNRHIPPLSRLKKLAALAVGFVGLLYLDYGLSIHQTPLSPPQKNDQSEISISFVESDKPVETPTEQPQKLSFEEYCRRNPISTCWNQQKPEDFLYEEDTPVAVIKTEEFSPDLWDKEETENIEATYEEQLPDDIIEASDVYTSKIYGMHIIPARKPPYFEKPVIAIVIDDMGISLKRTADIASLHAPLTASFLTYGRNLSEQIENSRRAGQEIIIHIPMEAKSDIDTAPDVLTTKMSKDEIKQNLTAMLKKFDNVLGINNHMGSKLTEDKERMSAIMEILKQNNLFFLDSKTSANSQADKAATKIGVAYAHRHVFIDNNNDKKYILGQLHKAEKIAKQNGYAIAIGHPKTQTYTALKEWLPTLNNKNITLVPLSNIVRVLHPHYFQ
ncbi:MAG: divergent polysaccharide deacetylase family protein [Alphaproteobacteria bacterium]|nr:divergent polysaccharide deacetylase family protein [Alphaproteobacteria bacterium]